MKYSTAKKVGMVVAALLGCAVISACSNTNAPYRTYYLGKSCHTFYTDIYGNRVYGGSVAGNTLVGLPLMRDASGRWYYQDSFGNRIYKVVRCHR